MKIIDWDKKGNLVRFYLGADDLEEYYGDDWNDRPYEHNAGVVYDRYIAGFCDVVFPWNWIVREPAEDWRYDGNSPWRKDDMRERKVPCLVAIREDVHDSWDQEFPNVLANDAAHRFYFGDSMEPSEEVVIFQD